MKMISELAYDTIIALKMVPDEHVGLDRIIYESWDGGVRLVVSEDQSIPDEYFDGPMSKTTNLTILTYSEDRGQAVLTCQQAAEEVRRAFNVLAHKKGSGILSITDAECGVKSATSGSDLTGYEAFRSFSVMVASGQWSVVSN